MAERRRSAVRTVSAWLGRGLRWLAWGVGATVVSVAVCVWTGVPPSEFREHRRADGLPSNEFVQRFVVGKLKSEALLLGDPKRWVSSIRWDASPYRLMSFDDAGATWCFKELMVDGWPGDLIPDETSACLGLAEARYGWPWRASVVGRIQYLTYSCINNDAHSPRAVEELQARFWPWSGVGWREDLLGVPVSRLPVMPVWRGLLADVGFFGGCAAVVGLGLKRWRRRAPGMCVGCGYSVEGLMRCPECGREVRASSTPKQGWPEESNRER